MKGRGTVPEISLIMEAALPRVLPSLVGWGRTGFQPGLERDFGTGRRAAG